MKSLLRVPVTAFLALLARSIVRKYRPKVVMVTGSVGKTSTKDAVAAALSSRFYLRASEKSYNSEFGVPLTIIGAKNPWANPAAWLSVFCEAFTLLLIPAHYPKLLVLEVGADRPGDLKQILRIVTPDAVVVTRLPDIPVHVEAYASAEAVREEEFTPAYALPKHAPLIVCADDAHALRLSERLPVQVTTFGFAPSATVKLSDVRIEETNHRPAGMQVTAVTKDGTHTLSVLGALGRSQVYAPAAALATALALGISTKDALKGLMSYVPPPGRARILRGIRDSIIIDDSYNASPAAVGAILDSMDAIPAKRRIAVLGDMLELGRYSREEHERVGALAAKKTSLVIAVGSRARAIAESAKAAGVEAHAFKDAHEACTKLPDMITEGDLILIKGSQSIRLEHVVKALLADSSDAALLVRQDPEWLNKP